MIAACSSASVGKASMRQTSWSSSSSRMEKVRASVAGSASSATAAASATARGPHAMIWTASSLMGGRLYRSATGKARGIVDRYSHFDRRKRKNRLPLITPIRPRAKM